MNIGFRVDASNRIGSGHWSRCFSIASQIKKKNNIFFLSRNLPGNRLNQIKNSFSLVKLKKIKKYKFDQNCHESNNNLGLPEEIDFLETLNAIIKYKIEVLVIDHYSINETYKKLIKNFLKYLIVIDDFTHKKHYADLSINNNFLSENDKKKIKTLNPKCKFLLGSNYPSVNLNFHNLKRKVKERKKIKKILVFFGSIDPTGETFKALSVLKKFPNIKTIMVTSKSNPRFKMIQKIIKKEKNLRLLADIKNLNFGHLILKSDLAIGSCGVNIIERLYLGLPSLVITTAKNQIIGAKNLKKRKLVRYLGKNINVSRSDIRSSLEKLLYNEKKFKKFSRRCFLSMKNQIIFNLSKEINLNLKKIKN